LLQNLNSHFIKPNRVVIVGAQGFTGSALVSHLNDENIPSLSLSRSIIDLSQLNAAQKIRHLLDKDDVIIMLAATMANNSMNSSALKANIQMAENICSAIQDVRCQHVIYVSSDAVYPTSIETISEAILPSPANLYGVMHLAREMIFKQCMDKLAIPLAIIRPTQIYGSSATHNAYGPCRMLRSIIFDGKIQLFGLGEEKRDFISIGDFVNLVTLIIGFMSQGIINIATGRSISFAELAALFQIKNHTSIQIEHLSRTAPIWHRNFDVTNLKNNFPEFQCSDISINLKQMLNTETQVS
jgi:UDP-glucose 4-epimerase